jgi:DNA-binding transcriptional ArsR family regulator
VSEASRQLQVDPAALKALAHPLRVRMYDLLDQEGPATASQLAEKVGESSGTTSYHLRQLARHGFIEEDPERGNRRDRWWRVRPGGFHLEGWRYLEDPDTAAQVRMVGRELVRTYAGELQDWLDGVTDWEREWVQASVDSVTRFEGTREELAALRDEVMGVIERHTAHARNREAPEDSARLIVHFHAFPSRPGSEDDG